MGADLESLKSEDGFFEPKGIDNETKKLLRENGKTINKFWDRIDKMRELNDIVENEISTISTNYDIIICIMEHEIRELKKKIAKLERKK